MHKLIRKLIAIYKKNEEQSYKKRLSSCGKNTKLEYPCIIGHGEFVDIGDSTTILADGRIQTFPDKVQKTGLRIGNNCFLGYRLCILAAAPIEIGNNVVFASDVTVVSHNHGIDPESSVPYMDQELTVASVSIGNNVWVGDKVIIMSGVTIGDNVVVGAGSIVNKDIPDNCMVAGTPARIIKEYNFDSHNWERV